MSLIDITSDYLKSKKSALDFYAWPPDGNFEPVIASRREQPGRLMGSKSDIHEIEIFNRAMGNEGDNTLRNIELLASKDTFCVVTGQQAGLLLSPLYIIYKAIAAIKLSKNISSLYGVSCVPIFWIASDDHDIEEVGTAQWIGKDGSLETFTLDTTDIPKGSVVHSVKISKEQSDALIASISSSTHGTDFKRDVIDKLIVSLEDEPNLETFFARCLKYILGDRGLIMVVPRIDCIRKCGADILKSEIEKPGGMSQAVIADGQKLNQDGYKNLIHRNEDDCNFFLEREGIRYKVRYCKDTFKVVSISTGDMIETFSQNEMSDLFDNSPQLFSPNVVTRPIVQDYAFSTLAYVGGPGEIAYHAQLKKVYNLTNTFRPVLWPRPRVTLIEPRTARSLNKLSIEPEEYLKKNRDDWHKIILSKSKIQDTLDLLKSSREKIEKELSELSEHLSSVSSQLSKPLEKTRQSVTSALSKLESRVEHELAQTNNLINHLDKIELALRQQGQPQERVLNPICPFLIQYGDSFITRLMENVNIEEFSMQTIDL